MKYTIKYLFKDCFNPNFISNKFTYFTEIDNIYYLCYNDFDFSNLQKLNNDSNQCYGFIIDSIFCTQDPTKSINILDIEKGEKYQVKGDYLFLCKDDRFIYLLDESKNTCNRLNPFTKEISMLFKVSDEAFLRYKEFVVPNLGIGYSKLNEIKLLNIKTGDLLWCYNIEAYFNAPSGVYQGRVFVVGDRLVFFAHTKDWKKGATFVLDAQTGEVLNNPAQTIFGGKLFLFDGYIWQKKDKGFAKMDPNTFEVTHYDLSQELPTEIIDNKTMAYHDGVIAVSAKPQKGSIRSLVLLFDTKTEQIIWRKEILHDENKASTDANRRQIEEIQMNEKYIAVSTSGYSLYVFEKE